MSEHRETNGRHDTNGLGTNGADTSGLSHDDVWLALSELTWGDGLTRTQIRHKYRALPHSVYLRLPSSKRYRSPDEVLREAGMARSRAEGDFMGADPDLPEAEAREEGGPPAWGPDPIFTPGASVDSASAEDRTRAELGDS
jgi:hypothetical protein